MMHAIGLGLVLLIGVAEAAEPTAPPAGASGRPPAAATPAPGTNPSMPPKRLDLRAARLRDLMTPRDIEALMSAPDFEKDAVVVEGKRELLTMKFEEPVPAGFPPATLWWALRNPSQSWRVLLPDLNRPAAGPLTMEEKIPAREFRWGP